MLDNQNSDNHSLNYLCGWPFGPSTTIDFDYSRELSFIASGGGVYIYDISILDSPRKVSESIRTKGYISNMHYDSSLQVIFIATGGTGVEIWDVSEVEHPKPVIRLECASSAFDIAYDSNYLYVNDGSKGMTIYSTTNLIEPERIGHFPNSDWNYSVKIIGENAFILDGSVGLRIIDIKDKSIPKQLSYINIDERSDPLKEVSDFNLIGDNFDMFVDKNRAYLAHNNNVTIVNIADKCHPKIECKMQFEHGVSALYVKNNKVYIISPYLMIFDESNIHEGSELVKYEFKCWQRDIGIYKDNLFIVCLNKVLILDATELNSIKQVSEIATPGFLRKAITRNSITTILLDDEIKILELSDNNLIEQSSYNFPEPKLVNSFCINDMVKDKNIYLVGQFGLKILDSRDNYKLIAEYNEMFNPSDIAIFDNIIYIVNGNTLKLLSLESDNHIHEISTLTTGRGQASNVYVDKDMIFLYGYTGSGLSCIETYNQTDKRNLIRINAQCFDEGYILDLTVYYNKLFIAIGGGFIIIDLLSFNIVDEFFPNNPILSVASDDVYLYHSMFREGFVVIKVNNMGGTELVESVFFPHYNSFKKIRSSFSQVSLTTRNFGVHLFKRNI